jgi:putative peptidoglycan lipid II flippase
MISISRIYDKFAVTIISSYPFSIITVVFIIFFSETLGIYALVISYILFLLIQVSILVLSARKIFNFKAILNFTNGDLRSVVKLSLPIYLSIAVWEIDAIVNRMLASGLPEGSITAMAYADRLRYLPDGIITASVLAVIYPLLSKYAAQKDIFNLKAITVKSLSLLTMALLPIIAVSIYYATEITKIVYERGAFTSDNTILTANVFIFIIMSLFFSGGAALLSNSFYGSQDTKTPQIAAVIMVTFKITLSVILVPHMQAAGLALATSIAFLVFFITLSIQFRVKFGAFGGRALFKNSVKCIFASICMIPVFILCEFFRDKLPLFFFFAAAAAISLCVYALLLFLLRAELFMEALKRVKTYLLSKRKIKN